MATSELKMKVTADANAAKTELQNISKQLSDMNKMSFTKMAAQFDVVTMAAKEVGGAIGKVISTTKEWVNLYKVQETAEIKLTSALKATGNQFDLTADSLKQYAANLQSVTRFGDEAIIEATSLLVATKKLNQEGIERTLEVSADLAEAMGTDITNAASQLAKILQEPTTGLDRLKQSGINFTDQEKEQIKQLTKANRLYEAQALVLDKVESSYGGLAKELAATDTGKLEQMANVWGDIKENLGGTLLESISPALNAIYEALLWLDEKMREFRQEKHSANLSKAIVNAIDNNTGFNDFTTEALQTELANRKTIFERAQNWYYFDGAINKKTFDTYEDAWLKYGNPIAEELARRAVAPSFMTPETPTTSSAGGVITPVINTAPAANVSGFNFLPTQPVPQFFMDALKNPPSWMTDLDVFDLGAKNSKTETAEPTYLEQYKQKVESLRLALDQLANEIAGTTDPATRQYLEDINEGLQEEYDSLTQVREKANETAEELKKALKGVADYSVSAFDKITESLASMWTNQANVIKSEMERLKEEGTLTVEQQQEMQSEMNKLNKKAFYAKQANAIAEATTAYASGVMNIWKDYASNPVLAGVMTGILSGTYGVQLASISSQKYTPFATGGIVTGPVHGLVGEAGPEAIIPLSSPTADRILGNGGGVTVVVNGNIYGDAEDQIFNAIERAQRVGRLPSWRYA